MLFFRFSRTGLAIRALLQQRTASALVGIEADRINRVVFALGFAMAGLAGCLVSLTEPISPFGGFSFTISAFVVIILCWAACWAGLFSAPSRSSAWRSLHQTGIRSSFTACLW
jgi:branched-subunit amino acid ABC-type transport system permease component